MTLHFDETAIPPDETDPIVPDDETPGFDPSAYQSTPDTTCITCKLRPRKPYGGRGKRPTKCVECSAPKTRSDNRPSNPRWKESLTTALASQFVGFGMAIYVVNQYDGKVVIQGSPRLAASLADVAESNAAIREALEKFVTAGTWAGVVGAGVAIAIPIMANHHLLPIDIPGFGPTQENASS